MSENIILTDKVNKYDSSVSKEKILYLEVIRIIAALFVVFIHTDSQGFNLYMKYPCESWRFWVYLLISICCSIAVPLFFCISGVLLLNRKDEPLKTLWKNRIMRIVIDLIVFSLAYAFFASWINGTDYNLVEYLRKMYASETYGHLWFLYAYIAFLISTPFLKIMVKNLNNQYFIYLIVICIVVSSFGVIKDVFGDNYGLNEYLIPAYSTSWAIIYPCIGYYLHYRIDAQKIKNYFPALWSITILLLFLVAFLNFFLKPSDNHAPQFTDCFIIINCITVFLTVRYLFEKKTFGNRLTKAIVALGSCTFGVYLLHIFVLQNPAFKAFRRSLLRHFSAIPMIGIWIYILFAFIICIVATYLFKKIPIIKRLF